MKHYPPVGEAKGKKKEVALMFDAVAPRYDLLNRLLSGGIDRSWRKAAVNMLAPHNPNRILDLATGTADLAVEAMRLNPEKIVGVDIAEEMLKFGREKLRKLNLDDQITLQRGDAEKLPFSDSQFDAAMVSFGVRNFENLQKGLKEIRRVLKPGGALVILEFSRPRAFPIKQFYGIYSKYIMPAIGKLFSKSSSGAYKYLPDSIAVFPDGDKFLAELEAAGYENGEAKRLTFGVASLYKGMVPGKK